jgi:transposase InsO family protein
MEKRRKFSAEFKCEAVQMTTLPSATIRQVAKDSGINERLLGRWRRDVMQRGDKASLGTFIRTAESWLYLCVVIDLYSRLAVGWSTSAVQDRQLVLQAVLMALWQREDREAVFLHSDRGRQVHERRVSALPAATV